VILSNSFERQESIERAKQEKSRNNKQMPCVTYLNLSFDIMKGWRKHQAKLEEMHNKQFYI